MSVNFSLLAGAGWQFFTDAGVVLSGGKLYTYAAGTTTPQTTYTSVSGSIANSNPIILDSSGRVPEQIWLTPSISYKFVLYDANDVLIWTEDNISSADDLDAFIADLANASDPAKGDALVGFRQSNNSGNLTGSVNSTVHKKLQEIISFKDFGATGDGTTNDQAAIQAALYAANGQIIDGQNLTYKVNSSLAIINSNTVVQNATFDFSDMPDGAGIDRCLDVFGSIGTADLLTTNLNINSATVTVVSTTGWAANDLVFLKSTTVWDSASSVTYGQYARIKSIDSATQISLYEGVLLSFTTAASASIAKVTPIKNVSIDHVTFIGKDANLQNALYVQYGENVSITNCEFIKFDYAGVSFFRCYKSTIDKCRQRNGSGVGFSYGYALLDGCYACSVTNSWGEDNRHTVTVGGNSGINMFCKIIGCNANGSKDAGFDSHSASLNTLFMGNHVINSAARFGASANDGIISQGANTSFIGNTVINPLNNGIFYQPLFQDGTYSGATISDNTVVISATGDGSIGIGIYVQVAATTGATALNGILIKNNRISGGDANPDGSNGIFVIVQKTNATINGLIVEGNYVTLANATTAYPLYLRTNAAGAAISNVSISNNTLKSDNQDYAMFLQASNATSSISNITGTSNIFDSNLYSIILSPTGTISKLRFSKNISLAPDFIDNNGATDYLFDDIDAAGIFTATNATLIDFTEYDWYIFNRAGTVTVTLPASTTSKGRTLNFKTIQAQTVVSATSNVQPINDTVLGTAILPATDGAWATLYCNGTDWVIMARGT